MKLSITYIELKSPLKMIALASHIGDIMKQLKLTTCKNHKISGFWTKHYTMTLWQDEQSMNDFARSGAHLVAMKNSAKFAKEIKVLTIDSEVLLPWKEAKNLLENSKNVLKY
jgi:hypothetical protein